MAGAERVRARVTQDHGGKVGRGKGNYRNDFLSFIFSLLGNLGLFCLNALPHPSAHTSGRLQVVGLGYKLEDTLFRHNIFTEKGITNEAEVF